MDKQQFSRRVFWASCVGMVLSIALAAFAQQWTPATITEEIGDLVWVPGEYGTVVDGQYEYLTNEGFTITVTPEVGAAPPQFTSIQATQWILSLIRGEYDEGTGDLVTLPLSNDPGLDCNEVVEAFYVAYPNMQYVYPEGHVNEGQPVPYSALTSTQKGNKFRQIMYTYCKQVYQAHAAGVIAANEAVPTAKETAATEAETLEAIDEE